MENSCRRTILACYIGYIVQAIVNNFVPLLFVMFERTYQIPLAKITLLITINFCIQLAVDLLSAWFLDRIGYRAAILLSHIASAAGLVLVIAGVNFCCLKTGICKLFTRKPDRHTTAVLTVLLAFVLCALGVFPDAAAAAALLLTASAWLYRNKQSAARNGCCFSSYPSS